ncbi:hypothetical protein GGS20DRAFT_268069 [Poronia punctata]|nr:hypothetical protein GGS20DRAFT_268069 [Poronia punctata]
MRGLLIKAPTRPMSQLTKQLSQKSALATQRRHLSIDIDRIKADMFSRTHRVHRDYLQGGKSRLLDNALSDLVPEADQLRYGPRVHKAMEDPRYKITPHAPRALPPGHHLIYFPPAFPGSKLSSDGADQYHSPGVPEFTRRVWASGSLAGLQTSGLLLGEPAVCLERIIDVSSKGPPGAEKIFVEILREHVSRSEFYRSFDMWKKELRPRMEILDPNEDASIVGPTRLTERRTLVFMRSLTEEEKQASLTMDRKIIRSSMLPSYSRTMTPTKNLLFQFSALSYNAHRIHLDTAYCREVEGYRTLLVHGPLSLNIMIAVLRSYLAEQGWPGRADLQRIDYRHLAPLYVDEPFRVCLRPELRPNSSGAASGSSKWHLWIENADGGVSVKAEATTKRVL